MLHLTDRVNSIRLAPNDEVAARDVLGGVPSWKELGTTWTLRCDADAVSLGPSHKELKQLRRIRSLISQIKFALLLTAYASSSTNFLTLRLANAIQHNHPSFPTPAT